jgi:hypothetical protein
MFSPTVLNSRRHASFGNDVSPTEEFDERSIGDRLRALGAEVKMTRKGRVHTIDFRAAPASFGREALACLEGLKRVKELHLSGAQVDDEAAAALSRHDRLETLDLERTAVTDAALPHLARMKRLKLLVLRGTAVSSEVVAALRKEMIGTRIVT